MTNRFKSQDLVQANFPMIGKQAWTKAGRHADIKDMDALGGWTAMGLNDQPNIGSDNGFGFLVRHCLARFSFMLFPKSSFRKQVKQSDSLKGTAC